MSRPTLRIFDSAAEHSLAASHVSVRLGDIGPLLADAYGSDRTWTKDFGDQRIRIPTDLYDVIRAYRTSQKSG